MTEVITPTAESPVMKMRCLSILWSLTMRVMSDRGGFTAPTFAVLRIEPVEATTEDTRCWPTRVKFAEQG